MSTNRVSIVLDGQPRTFWVEPHNTLFDVLRREAHWSVRFGSDSGETGAAAVLFDGRLVSSEILLAAQADGHVITTIATLNQQGVNFPGGMHPIQVAFMATGLIVGGYAAAIRDYGGTGTSGYSFLAVENSLVIMVTRHSAPMTHAMKL